MSVEILERAKAKDEAALMPRGPDPISAALDVFASEAMFVSAQRMATLLSSSSIVPETYRGRDKIGDCVIALDIASRIGANVLAVMQNLYIVHGRPAWSSAFLISCVNASKRFTPMRYDMRGTKGQDDYGCVAWAADKEGVRLESPEVTVGMAKAEGWYQRNGSKWKTLPELMLRYRAATFWTRLYCPELTMGIRTEDEIRETIEVESTVTSAPFRPELLVSPAAPALPPPVTVPPAAPPSAPKATRTAPAPAPAPTPPTAAPAAPAPAPQAPAVLPQASDEQAEAEAGLAPLPETTHEAPAPIADPPTELTDATADPELEPQPGDHDQVKSLKLLARGSGVTMAQLIGWLRSKKMAKYGQTLGDVSPLLRDSLIKAWNKPNGTNPPKGVEIAAFQVPTAS